MIIGSGLLANSFPDTFRTQEDVCIYAAGVSNSGCTDQFAFDRERQLLVNALKTFSNANKFVYFGTCSVADPEAKLAPYVLHKLKMESLVLEHSNGLVLRLPQVAGNTSNPHTLLNYLYTCISSGKSFDVWAKARRNIVDVMDISLITQALIKNDVDDTRIFNIANKINYSMLDIVRVMESAVGKRAIFNTVDRGSDYAIDISKISHILKILQLQFSDHYLQDVVRKYYAKKS